MLINHQIKSLCHQGAVRKNNEDAISHSIHESLGITWMVIADGMGGHNAGEVASAILIEQVTHGFDNLEAVNEVLWEQWIVEQLTQANLAILQTAHNNPAQQGMGTTGVLAILVKNLCYIGWIGDSRAYSLKQGVLKQETIDHTMIQELVNKGAISAETARNSNTKNLLSQAIGVQEKISVDTCVISVNNDDTIMLSTDGLHDYLTEQEITDFLVQEQTNHNICNDMVNKAMLNKSRDNITVGLISVKS